MTVYVCELSARFELSELLTATGLPEGRGGYAECEQVQTRKRQGFIEHGTRTDVRNVL